MCRIEKDHYMKKFLALLLFSVILLNISGQESFKDKRDGSVYRTVKVEDLTWMAENLRFKAPKGSFYFDNNPANYEKYGMLYDWKTASRICPDGWRLPTGEEYQTLVNINEQKDSWKNGSSVKNSFDIQLGGMQDHEGNYTEMEESAYFWTSTEYDSEHAEYFSYMLMTDQPAVDVSRKEDIEDIHGTEKTNKYSVRCVRNK